MSEHIFILSCFDYYSVLDNSNLEKFRMKYFILTIDFERFFNKKHQLFLFYINNNNFQLVYN